MPTSLDRIQCLMPPETYAAVLTLCNVTGKTKSNMTAELIQASLRNPKYRSMLQEADDAMVVAPKEDPRTEERRKTTHRQPSASVRREIASMEKKADPNRKSYTELLNPEQAEVTESFGLDSLTPDRIEELKGLLTLLQQMKA